MYYINGTEVLSTFFIILNKMNIYWTICQTTGSIF